jgi:hypothetical protein
VFEAGQVLARVQEMGDLLEPVITIKQKLPKLAGIAESAQTAERGLDLAAQAEDARPKKAKKSARSLRGRSAPQKPGKV